MTDSRTLADLRRLLLILFYVSAVVLVGELLLLEHTETVLQLLPLGGIAAGVVVVTWLWLRPGPVSLRTTQLLMVALAIVGLVGVYLHYRANVELELEILPGMGGWELVWEALHGGMPALAPALMGQLGLLGLAYTFRHPAGSRDRHTVQEETP